MSESASESKGQRRTQAEENGPAEWIVEIQLTLGCVNHKKVKTCSICRVPERIGEAEAEDFKAFIYRPQLVAMGPFHRGTRTDLQIMEEIKWQFMLKLLRRPKQNRSKKKTVQSCSEAIMEIDSLIRASYGEKIEMGAEELSRIMLLDGCFLLELLLRLTKNEPLDYIDDNKKRLRLLTDLTLLENQIPFVLLTKLSSELFKQELASLLALSPQKLAESPFECNVARSDVDLSESDLDLSKGVYHFLHLMHLCSPDPYEKEERGEDPLQLQRCARKLQAFGITIKASQPNDSKGSNRNGTAASALGVLADKFEFKIEFNEKDRELIIPTLHIKEATEVKWRNLIAWEQIGLIGIGYKCTSYAFFFKGLVRSVHDLQLLKDEGVISVHKKVKDEDLVKMFQSITKGAEQMDGRYRAVCNGLNKAKVNGVAGCCVLVSRMPWHYWRSFLELLRSRLISWILSFIETYLGSPWKFVGVLYGAALLVLTIMQTVYAARDQ